MQKEDRRVKKTKTAITQALLKLLKTQDLNTITINELTKEADINRGTFYFHYEDKYDLLNNCIAAKLLELQKICAQIKFSSDATELESYFKTVYQFFEDNYDFFVLMLKGDGVKYFQQKFKQQIINELTRTTISSNNEYIGNFSNQFKSHALAGIVEWWLCEDHSLSVGEMAQNTATLFIKNQ